MFQLIPIIDWTGLKQFVLKLQICTNTLSIDISTDINFIYNVCWMLVNSHIFYWTLEVHFHVQCSGILMTTDINTESRLLVRLPVLSYLKWISKYEAHYVAFAFTLISRSCWHICQIIIAQRICVLVSENETNNPCLCFLNYC